MSRSWSSVLALSLAVGALGLPASDAAAQAPPDVVMTRDGGMMRGTIVEHVPNSHVVLQMPTGETRRIDGSWVTYAGPASGAPDAAAPGTSSGRGGVRLRLEADQPRTTFHLLTGTATATAWGPGGTAFARAHAFDRLCTAPCETSLPTGTQRLGLSVGDGDAIAAPSVDIPGPGTLVGTYTDNTGIRVAGWTLFGVGAATGIGIMLVPLFDENLLLSDDLWIFVGVGAGIAILAAAIGAPLGFLSDGATIRFQ
ncbi:MAG TPA: hypothetical protein RMH99_14005 [Sandaracinaceae bacterium LLY-WYZ-13_1]|nr:hypothetical protein [Sandaracinaceae bacterium LLY-WYZ-13_1]